MKLEEHLASIWEQVGPEIKVLAEAEVIEPFSCVPEDWYYCDRAVIQLQGEEKKRVLEFYGDDEPNWYHGFFLEEREEPVPLA